jgi:Fe2+ or Zn2+ uptake regulation protein
MTKSHVLEIFARRGGFLKPDEVVSQLRPIPDLRSLYSYLARLRGQGLFDRHPHSRRGQLAYRLTERGRPEEFGIGHDKLSLRWK